MPSAAEPRAERPSTTEHSTVEGQAGEGTFLDAPPFPGLQITDAIRIRLQTFTAPDAAVGSGHVTLVRPELAVRATAPVTDRAMLRIAIRLAHSQYRFHGDVWGNAVPLPGVGVDPDAAIGDLDLYAAQLALEGAYRLSRDTHWLARNEEWAAIGALYAGSRWEDGHFHSGLDGGGAIGFGYEIPDRLRLALGVSLRTPLDHADVDVGPLVSLRWRPIDRFTLRTRELGLQAEYQLTPPFETYLTGFRSTDRFTLNDRGLLGDLLFRDRSVRVGLGFEWTLANWLHLQLEGGAIVDRRLRVQEEDLGTILSRSGDPSGYVDLHLELRL
jgi:hypothetical protein